MEKVSRKQRAAARAASHRERFSPWSQSSLLDLLTAAACSPGALHRYSSVGYTIKDVIHLRPTGTTRIPEEKLQELLDDTLTRKPQLRSLEDYIPLNPATCVKVRVRGRRYRLHPAGLERPVIAVARTLRVAYAVDATLLKLEGFGVEDLLELVLRYVDRFIEVCSPFWPEQVAEDLDASPNVRAAEVEAIRDVPSLEAIAEECMYPERALRALKWGTVERRQINFEPDGDTILGMPLAVRLSAGVIWPMPPSFLMESLFASAQNLAQRALRASQECSERFHSVSVRSTTKFFGMRAPDLSEQRINVGSFNALLPIAAKHWLALEMVSSLDATTLDDGVHGAVERLRLVCPGQRYARGTGRTAHIPMDAEVVRLLIVSGAGHLTLNSPPGVACMTLDDLEWISSTAEKPEDIFLFSRDLAAPPGVGRVMSFETINAWEIWRNVSPLQLA